MRKKSKTILASENGLKAISQKQLYSIIGGGDDVPPTRPTGPGPVNRGH